MRLILVSYLLAASCAGGAADAGADLGDGDGADGVDAGEQLPSAPDAHLAPDAVPELAPCTIPGRAIVTDIDATLTTSDNEFLTQLLVPGTDPAERPGANELISAYADRGYFIVYLTSRPDGAPMATGTTTRVATLQWLTEHGFPVDPERTRLELAPGLVFGASSAAYKGDALIAMQDEGFVFDFAYGNATSDIDAYEAAGIPKTATFIIGPEAGVSNTMPIAGDGWIEHASAQLPGVSAVCQ